MKQIKWNLAKNEELKKKRGISFEELITKELVAVKKHPQRKHQSLMLFKHKGYIWVVPYVETKDEIFLKTLFPSRKYTKFLKKENLQ